MEINDVQGEKVGRDDSGRMDSDRNVCMLDMVDIWRGWLWLWV